MGIYPTADSVRLLYDFRLPASTTVATDFPKASRTKFYRDTAIALRALAPTFKDAEARKELHVIAADYELLAKHAERLRAFNRPLSR